MIYNPDKKSFSLCRTIFAGSWLIVLAGATNYIFNAGPDVATLAGTLLAPAGAVYAMRAHTQSKEVDKT